MRTKSWTNTAAVAVLFLTTAILMGSDPARTAESASRWGASYFPNVALTTQEGQTVRLWDDLLKGDKNVVINFFYTHCTGSCPRETAKLVEVQKLLKDRMGKDVFFYSISLDPKRDTPAVLKAYAEKVHAGPGWLFLTGEKADIALVRKKLGLGAAINQDLKGHSTRLTIGNSATGQWILDDSAWGVDPRYVATMVGDWLSSWKVAKPGQPFPGVQRVAKLTTVDKGQYLFKTRCTACHTMGKGEGVGPDLLGVTNTRDRTWLARYVAAPEDVLASGDPIATALYAKYKQTHCPNLNLGEKDVEALVQFLEAHSAPAQLSEIKDSLPRGGR